MILVSLLIYHYPEVALALPDWGAVSLRYLPGSRFFTSMIRLSSSLALSVTVTIVGKTGMSTAR